MSKKPIKRLTSAALAVLLVFLAGITVNTGALKADAASWNGTNFSGGEYYGYRTFLDAFGIDYNTYMKWMDSHDEDNYYLGTPYVGYDHRNPHGDCKGALGYYDTPGVEGLNCTGFVWHMLYKSAQLSGASRSQINSLPVMGAVPSTWSSLGVYRIYFRTKEEALASGVLEKGDLLWIYGTKDNHNAIFYGNNSSHDRFWHSAGKKNELAKIRSAGTFLGMWVAKVTMPHNIELHANIASKGKVSANNNLFGTKYCVFNDKAAATAAANGTKDNPAWDKRIGTIVTDSSGYGCFRTAGAPKNADLRINGAPQKNLSYFSSAARKVSAQNNYYAVEWTPPVGSPRDTSVYEFKDSGKRTSVGYKQYSFKPVRKVATPQLKYFQSTPEGVRLGWDAVPGAQDYRVYYKASNGSWKKFAQTSGTSCIDDVVSPGTSYTYTIRCVDHDGDFTSDYNRSGWTYKYSGIETPVFSSLESVPDGVKLSWNAVPGAAAYRLYYKNRNGDWKKLTDTKSTSFVDADVTIGTTYTYTIRCLNSAGRLNSAYVRDGWKHTFKGIATPKITSGVSVSNGISLSWDAVPGASLYRVFYKTSSGWKRLGDTASTSILDTVVTRGKSYTYTVRCVNSLDRYNSAYDKTGITVKFNG